ncbi:hypothetical protein A2U01_0016108 [Trifolium medium]|uniref:Uncharacterized protein n=1 Tax=Trifolium medium TaxID=97028 RepID=A0A392N9J6_9FABA|nr:hypothetical protein [Trifolium medium]
MKEGFMLLVGRKSQHQNVATDSSLWKVLVSLKTHVDRCSYWVVGDGRDDIEAWEDIWIEEGLCIAQHNNIPQEIQSARVCDLVDAAGNWSWALLQPWMPRDMQNC